MAKDNREGIDDAKRIVGGGRTADGIDYIEYVDGTRAPVSTNKSVNNTIGELSITIEADVSNAVKGVKALQREIRETTKALRECEAAVNDVTFRFEKDGN